MEIRQLRYFVAVADDLSFRRAADKLHVAQPALSRQIQQLEALLGVLLIERDKRHVALTPAGDAVLKQARTVLTQMQQLPLLAQRAAAGHTGHLRVGFISLVAYEFLPMLVRGFRSEFPNVDVKLNEFQVLQQFEPLMREDIDVAILRLLKPDAAIASYVIQRQRFVVALPKGHPLCQCESVAVGDLAREEFVSLPAGPGRTFGGLTLKFCRDAGFEPKAMHDVGDSQAMMGMVGAGVGVAIVPEAIRHLHTDGVEYRPLSDLEERAEIAIAWRARDTNPLVSGFVGAARRIFPAQCVAVP
ncbi:LysR family transcriptional regulator [Variovorax sp. 770b2]|uniref:LysR family transcriptional regulator n=1 Tax=Variovorax sp. 770b2 TaxID=1566271 RepID=UPI0008E92496|nr:LysR family transcriptional regulator [Variovorax sp. 770b2]SFQ01830.1 DNA-binding transcriptional regulator, LysR family [Variovorax sp. 770b2]